MLQDNYSHYPKCLAAVFLGKDAHFASAHTLEEFAKGKIEISQFLSLSQGSVVARSISPVPSGAPDPPQDQTCPQEDS